MTYAQKILRKLQEIRLEKNVDKVVGDAYTSSYMQPGTLSGAAKFLHHAEKYYTSPSWVKNAVTSIRANPHQYIGDTIKSAWNNLKKDYTDPQKFTIDLHP